ncbi:hypothetical protein [Puniceibacterium antarcticum]|nr:hypothetical protein [Puniceibacterium antarcticum]
MAPLVGHTRRFGKTVGTLKIAFKTHKTQPACKKGTAPQGDAIF